MAYELAPNHAARPRRGLRAVMILVTGALAVCCIGAAGLGAWSLQSVWRAEAPAREAAEDFLHALSSGDLDAAYDRLCADTRDRMGREGFAVWVQEQPKIDRYTISQVDVSSGENGLEATVSARLTWQTGVVAVQQLPMATDTDGWTVCGDPI